MIHEVFKKQAAEHVSIKLSINASVLLNHNGGSENLSHHHIHGKIHKVYNKC